jgi:Transposase
LAYFDTDRISDGPAEAINLLIKKIKRVGHGFRDFDNYRLRLLLYCGVEWQTSDATAINPGRGLGSVRRSTPTSCRSTNSSTSLVEDARPIRQSASPAFPASRGGAGGRRGTGGGRPPGIRRFDQISASTAKWTVPS